MIAAAGDIACDPTDPNFSGANPNYCQMRATANEIKQMAPQYVWALGDTQYIDTTTAGEQPTLSDYQQSYDQTWGKLGSNQGGPVPNANIHPVTGAAEYGAEVTDTGQPPFSNGSNYFTNFGPTGLDELPTSVTSNTNDWYSYNIPLANGGHWHVVALDSECNNIGGCGLGSPEETWLRSDLAANAGACTLVEMHDPMFTASGTYEASGAAQLWDDAVAAHVVAFVDGHYHDYQRFNPMNAAGAPDPTGTAEFIAGTGGESLDSSPGAPGSPPALAAIDNGAFGVLKLTLGTNALAYAFQTTGGRVADSGTLACGAKASGPIPAVTSVSPLSGPAAGGTQVTIRGTDLGSATGVYFGAVPATRIVAKSPTSITATAPAGSGTVDVTVVTSSASSSTSAADEYSYTQASNGYSVSLASGPTAVENGSAVTLTATANKDIGTTSYGLDIYDVTTGTLVARASTGTTVSATVSEAAATTQRYVAYVANIGPVAIQAASAPVVVSWSAPSASDPTVTALSPISGPAAGGTPVTITGTNFGSAPKVYFGTTQATAVTVDSATTLTATAPAGANTVDVIVETGSGSSPSGAADEYSYTLSSPGVSIAMQVGGPASVADGTPVTLTATSTQDVSTEAYGLHIYDVTTGALVASASMGTTVSATVSEAAATTQRYVAYAANLGPSAVQAASAPVVVQWVAPSASSPTVASVSPGDGPASGGTTVSVTGTNFTSGSAVYFGSAPASALKVLSSTSLQATAPAGTGTVDVTVDGPSGPSPTSAADEFSYTQSTGAFSVSLTSGQTTVGLGTAVTLTATTTEDVGPTAWGLYIYDVTTGTVVGHAGSGTTVSATVSEAAATTQRYVAYVADTGPTAVQAASAPVVVTWATSPVAAPLPTVSSVGPIDGPSTGATVVTIEGTGLSGATAVQFGGIPAASVTVTSDATITATAPVGAGTVDVTVNTAAGTSATGPADLYTYTQSSNGQSVALTADTTAPAVNGAVTLTATAGSTVSGTPYGLYIYDVTTATVVAHATAGTTASATQSEAAATTQRYVAYVADAGPTAIQATSVPVVVTWG